MTRARVLSFLRSAAWLTGFTALLVYTEWQIILEAAR